MLSLRSVSSQTPGEDWQFTRCGKGLIDRGLQQSPKVIPVAQTGHVGSMDAQGYAIQAGSRRASVEVTVAVGHNSVLVAAGLAATLARMPECAIRLSPISGSECGSECDHDDVQLIFGDFTQIATDIELPRKI